MLEARKQVKKIFEDAAGEKITLQEITPSPFADYSVNACFRIAGKLKKNPSDVAAELAKKIKPAGLIERTEAKNGFLNFYLNYESFAEHVLKQALKEGYGGGAPKDEKIILEHTSVNPSGPVHVGRIRNSIIGDSLRRILSFTGYKVETHYWVNDIGKQIAIIAQGWEETINEDEDLVELRRKYYKYQRKKDFEIFFEYVNANKKFEEDELFRERVQDRILWAEGNANSNIKRDANSIKSMKEVAKLCLEGQKETYNRLGFAFDVFDFESEELESGRVFKVLEELKKTAYWTVKEDVGAGLDLSSLGLERKSGLSVFERTDGTTVYLARDVSYHLEKLGLGDRLITVLGEDHKFEAQEINAILTRILGVKKPIDVVHFSFVNFEGEELSTRKGKTAPVDLLLDDALNKAAEEVEKRGIGGADTPRMVAVGAVKFHILKTNPKKPITFNWADALSFDGETAPYIQYAHARSARILEKAQVDAEKISLSEASFKLENDEEKNLVKKLSQFPEAVDDAVKELRPDILAQYLLGLVQAYGGFYMKCPVLESREDVKARRLLMVYALKKVLKQGLNLLGIEAPERM